MLPPSEELKIEISTEILPNGITCFIFDVTGKVDVYTTPLFKENLMSVVNDSFPEKGVIAIRFQGYMDASGYGTLLNIRKRILGFSGRICFVTKSLPLTRMLQITRLNTIFAVFTSIEKMRKEFGTKKS